MKNSLIKSKFILIGIFFTQILNAQTGTCLDFDGVNDNIEVPLVNFSSGNQMTIEAWIKPTNISSNVYYEISRQENSPAPDWLVSFQDNGVVLSFGLKTTTGYSELDVNIIASNYTDGNWHHVAAVYNGSMKYLYVDGVQIGSEPKTGNITFTGFDHRIGSQVGISEYFEGQIDEVRYWNIARTQCEINTFKNIEIPTTATGLIGNYHFNQGIAAGNNSGVITLTDAVGIVGTGTLTGFALTAGTVSNWVASSPLLAKVTGPSMVCQGNSFNYSVTAIPGATAYTWSLPSGWSGTSSTNTIFATAGASSGNISVTATSTCATTSQVALAVSVSPCTGVNELLAPNMQFGITPNPSNGLFIIKTDLTEDFDISIYNGIGQLIKFVPKNRSSVNIDLSNYGKGMYNVLFNVNGNYKNLKVIVE